MKRFHYMLSSGHGTMMKPSLKLIYLDYLLYLKHMLLVLYHMPSTKERHIQILLGPSQGTSFGPERSML